MRPFILPVVLLAALFGPAIGQAQSQPPAAHAKGDPWEGFNRRNFRFNQVLDRRAIRPLARLTSGLTPGPIGQGIRNFMVNLNEPKVIVNDLLQARPWPAIRSAFRLVVNTTIGVLGALDVAKALGDPMHVNGFGDTLGRWGIGPGPYLLLPVLGPATVRDVIGMVADDATVPLHFVSYPYRTEVTITVGIVGGLNERETVAKSYEALLNDATDPYATLRSTYMQFREAEIRGDKALPALPDFDETPAPGATPSPTPTTDTASPPAPTAAPVPSSDAPAAEPAGPPPSPDAAMPANPTPAPGPAPQDYPDMRGLF